MISPLLVAATFVLQPAPAVPEALGNAFNAWTSCLEDRMENAEQRRNARRMADAALRACQPQQRAFVAEHDRWLPTAGYNAAQMREARRNFNAQVAGIRAQAIEMAQSFVEED